MIKAILILAIIVEVYRLMRPEKSVQLSLHPDQYFAEQGNVAITFKLGFHFLFSIVYFLTTMWILVFGDNFIAQGSALIVIALSLLSYVIFTRIQSERGKATVIMIDAFLSIFFLASMVYYYQRPV